MKFTNKLSLTMVALMMAMASLTESCMEPCVEGNGVVREEERVVDNFSQVLLSGDMDVFIEQGTTKQVIVKADENLLPYVVTENRTSDLLEIRNLNNRCIRSSGRMQVTITTPNIYSISNNGSGDLYCDYVYNSQFDVTLGGSGNIDCASLDTQDLLVTLSGSGSINLQGKTITSDMLINGSGNIKAFDMDQDECYIKVTGSGNGYVFAFDYLNVNIPGSGSVFYRGAPSVEYRIDGSGRLVDANKK